MVGAKALRCRRQASTSGRLQQSGMRISPRWMLQPTRTNKRALASARLFTEYLRSCRDERFAMSLLPPGRFLMPGNLAGSPALTFAPLDLPDDGVAPRARYGR